jgi:hypothetical protein
MHQVFAPRSGRLVRRDRAATAPRPMIATGMTLAAATFFSCC